MKKIFPFLITTIFMLSLWSGYGNNANNTASAAVAVPDALTSAAASNKSYYIPYREYPLPPAVPNYPYRDDAKTDDCPTNPGVTNQYKTMPWLGDARVYGATTITGDNFIKSGGCVQVDTKSGMFYDGGTDSTNVTGLGNTLVGPWIPETAFGGWALKGTSNWSAATLIRDNINDKNGCHVTDYNLCSGWIDSVPQIWGSDHRFGRLATEKVDHYKDLYNRLGGAGDPTPANVHLFSSGTTLFRNEFTLTQEQIDNLSSINIELKADDFVTYYLNGVMLKGNKNLDPAGMGGDPERPAPGFSDHNFNLTGPQLQRLKNAHVFSTDPNVKNVFAVQVNDKARWTEAIEDIYTSNSNSAGLWYNVGFTVNQAPPMICTVTPQSGLTPLVVKATATLGTSPYTFNMGDGTQPLSGRVSPVYYTYATANTYYVDIIDSLGNTSSSCTNIPVTVTSPSSGGGGEVAP